MTKRALLLLVPFLLNFNEMAAQLEFVHYDDPVVTVQDDPWPNPWAGGMNSPQFSETDLNRDGVMDLVVFERNFYGAVKTFVKGYKGEWYGYVHAPIFQQGFPRMRNWMLMRDYNCDGKEDIFTSVPGGIAVYRNDRMWNTGMQFTLVSPLLLTSGINGTEPLYVATTDIPAITDVDGDGDLDILSFNLLGSTVEYHKNLSMENHGNCDFLEFELRNACWGFFSEDGNNNTVSLYDTCDVNVTGPEKSGRHAGSSLLAVDLTGNGAKDLVLGDITYNNLVALTNGGTTTASIMVAQDTAFPANTVPVDLTVFPALYEIDVDDDGARDLLVAPNNPNTSENNGQVWHYRREKNVLPAQYTYMKSGYLVDDMIDVGESSYPVFFDENGDGVKDIIAGNLGYFEGAGDYSSQLMLLRFDRFVSGIPHYDYQTSDYLQLSELGFNGAYPAFGDMDNDGDEDMLLGDEDGRLHYFRNEGGAGNPADLILIEPNYKGIDAGTSARPQIIDVNRDGLPDLLVGERGGTIQYFQNEGTPAEASFLSVPTNDLFGGIDVMPECCTGFSAPHMVEDSNGAYNLYVGSEQGMLYLFDGIENNITGSFNLVDSIYLHGVNVNVSTYDVNNDGKNEFLYGEFAGGIGMLREGKYPLGISEDNVSHILPDVYPNPATDFIRVSLDNPEDDIEGRVSVTDLSGRVLLERAFENGDIELNITHLDPGLYIVIFQAENLFSSAKFLKL
jgi:hypothetical protein